MSAPHLATNDPRWIEVIYRRQLVLVKPAPEGANPRAILAAAEEREREADQTEAIDKATVAAEELDAIELWARDEQGQTKMIACLCPAASSAHDQGLKAAVSEAIDHLKVGNGGVALKVLTDAWDSMGQDWLPSEEEPK